MSAPRINWRKNPPKLRRPVYSTTHSFWLHDADELRFMKAIVNRYGPKRGHVIEAIQEAILEWTAKHEKTVEKT